MKKLEPYENQMMYLVGGSRLPSTPGERELEHKCNPHPNDWIDGIYGFNKLPFAVRMQKGLVTQAEEEVDMAILVIYFHLSVALMLHISLT